MKIESVTISKLFSFGHHQHLQDFSVFNLFIGKNGTGKTNLFKVLRGIPVSFEPVGEKVTVDETWLSSEKGEITTQSEVEAYYPKIEFNEFENYETRGDDQMDLEGFLEIQYSARNPIKNSIESRKIIASQRGMEGFKFIQGNINDLPRFVEHLNLGLTEMELVNKLYVEMHRNYFSYLNFGLFYVFRLFYNFDPENRAFFHTKISAGGTPMYDLGQLPSGVLNVTKILGSILALATRRPNRIDVRVILMDDPEVYLEPRLIRRLFRFLVWLIYKGHNRKSTRAARICNEVETKIPVALKSYRGRIEHRILKAPLHLNQVFVASHSPVFINEFLNLEDSGSIYMFRNVRPVFHSKNVHNTPKGLVTEVTKIKSDAWKLIEELGACGSDILQTNGVVWVEGPSDVIFLRKWLEMYTSERSCEPLVQGEHFEFQMYGGAILDNIALEEEYSETYEGSDKLVSMFSFSKNSFVVIDSDAILNESGQTVIRAFCNAKKYIKNKFDQLNELEHAKLGLWYKEGNTEIRTIEDYLDDGSRKVSKGSKKNIAKFLVNSWGTSKRLSDFRHSLEKEIEVLYHTIKSWNS